MLLIRLCGVAELFLMSSIYVMLCSSTQNDLVAGSLVQKYVTIKNIGIKMCEVRCAEQGGCASFQYDLQTLTCRLPSCEMTMFSEKSGPTFLRKDTTHVFTGACGCTSCRLGSLCVRTRSRKSVCVKGGKEFSPARCSRKKQDKNSKDVNNLLHAACCTGDMCQVRNILAEGGVDINSRRGKYNRTPVMVAAIQGHGNVFDFLVKKGCDLSHVDSKGNGILHMVCNGGDIASVRYILSQGNVDVNRGRHDQGTPLMDVAYHGHKRVLELLVEKGGNVSLTDVHGDNILHKACSGGHIEMVKYVLSHTKLDINSRGRYRWTPLMLAAYKGHERVFELLVERGGAVYLQDANGDNILHTACSGGHTEMVKYVLSNNKLDINSRGRCRRTPLMEAAYFGHERVFELLVERGGDVSMKDANGDNILHRACSGGHSEMVKYVLSHIKLDINIRGRYGWTPLMLAAYFGHGRVFELLVERGGDVSLKDANGDNIFHKACSGGHTEMVKYVLSHIKLDINRRGQYGRTPLMKAAYFGHERVFELLVERGGDVSMKDANGENILHRACSGGHIEMVKYVLSHTKLDINSRGRYGWTPLMLAAYNGHERMFELLVERGGDVSMKDANGDNILHRACSGGHTEMVKYVLSHIKLDINSRGLYGRTPLMLAAYFGHERVFELLVERGGDVSLKDANGDNILHTTCSGGHTEMVKYVLSHIKLDINSRGRYGRTPLMLAAYNGHKRVFELLVERGGDVSLKDADGDNILHTTCSGGHTEMVKYVLSHIKLDINSRGRYGRTPLMLAAYNGHERVFELLVERGGDVCLKDAHGDNILHTACSGGHTEMVKYVLSHVKLDINSRGRYGRTPLMLAAYNGHERVFELLVERGGDVSLKDAHGDNILHTACSGGHTEIVKYVLLQDPRYIYSKMTVVDSCKLQLSE